MRGCYVKSDASGYSYRSAYRLARGRGWTNSVVGFLWGVNGVYRGGSYLTSKTHADRCSGIRYDDWARGYKTVNLGFRSEWCISRCRCY